MPRLSQEINQISSSAFATPEVRNNFLIRVKRGDLTRDENPTSHFSVYFLPYNPEVKKVFIVHHKKAGLWITPGGHINQGESLLQTLSREVKEELGFTYSIPQNFQPFLLTTTLINNSIHLCRTHFDIWYAIQTDGREFKIDSREFYETRWLNIPEARGLVTDPPNLQALDIVENNLF